MKRLLVLALAGCNQVYGLDAVKPVDAAIYDAPTTCPPLGGTIDFSPAFEQLVFNCASYTASIDRAILLCQDSTLFQIYGGAPDGPFAPIADLPRADSTTAIERTQLSADGALLLVRVRVNGLPALRTYRYASDTWTRGADITPTPEATSTPSSGPDHRVIAFSLGDTALRELSDANGTWQEVAAHPISGFMRALPTWLSPDGLRLVFFGLVDPAVPTSMRYLERTSTASTFAAPRVLTMTATTDVFVSADCARAYFSGLHSVFRANRL